ncbi:MAG: glycosyltransferase family 61 protein [Bacteroidota bacterium]
MLKRIYHKSLSILDAVLWKMHAGLERRGFIKPINSSMVKHIENGIAVDHPYPVNFIDEDMKLFAHYTGYKSGTETVFEFENINVSYDAILFKGMNNTYQSVPHIVFRADYGLLYILKNYLFKKRVKGNDEINYVLIYDFWSAGNYYHWLVDTLPRLLIFLEELKQKNYSLLLPADCRAFMKRTLSYYNIHHITFINENEFLNVKHLMVPYYLVGSGHIHPPKVLEIRQFFLNKIPGISNFTKLYVSRGRQKARKIVNEDSVIDVVRQFGFDIIYFEDYTFEQQVEIGRGAKYMVSSHGANLTNMMFMEEHTRVLELIRQDAPNFCYWALASAVKVDYYYQLCAVQGNDHLWVDIELFKLNLYRLLNE